MSAVCPACGSGRLHPAFRRRDTTFRRCRDCRSLVDTEIASPDQLARIYEGKGYYVKDDGGRDGVPFGYSGDYVAQRGFIEDKFDRVLGHIERYVNPGRLLDVGCGPGFLLAVATKRGWEAVGMDVNEWAVRYGQDVVGVEVQHGVLTAASFPDEKFDAITMMDLLEHVPEPSRLLEQAARLLRPGGALVVLTPDAGAPVSRLMGRRWPEVVPGEHTVLFSRIGLTKALARNGFVATAWHTVGKEAPIGVFLGDVENVLPPGAKQLGRRVTRLALSKRVIDVDPHTKMCVYARRLPDESTSANVRPARVPKRPEQLAQVDEAIVDELRSMAASPRLTRSMYDTFASLVPGSTVLEVGAGIGTFTQMMLDSGAAHVLAMEPEPACAEVLESEFADNSRVEISRDALPEAACLHGREGTFDLVVCNNVLEHIGDDRRAVAEMASALRPGGSLSLLVPAQAGLYGALDDAYGHWRRYTKNQLENLVTETGLKIDWIRAQNILGVAGWWVKNLRPGARVDPRSLKVYEAMMVAWQPIESRLHTNFGLSWVLQATFPELTSPL